MDPRRRDDDHVHDPAKPWMENQVRSLIGEFIRTLMPGTGEPVPEARLLEDLGITFLIKLDLRFAIEDEFGLPTIDQATSRTLLTVQEVENYVVGQLRASGRLSQDTAV
jgi:hypothetical protein